MNSAIASLAALVVAIVVSMTSRLNVGLLSLAFTWVLGVHVAGLKPDVVMDGFPVTLFLTLVGVTLLFGIADTNGTLSRLAHRGVRLTGGDARFLPLIFFVLAFALSAVGPGSISSVALLIPLAMAIAEQSGVSHFLTALMVANGANAGNLSPISTVGVIANSAMERAGLGGHEWRVFIANFVVHAVVSLAAWFVLARVTASRNIPDASAASPGQVARPTDAPLDALDRGQRLTILVIAAWIVGVVGFRLSLGLSAFAAAVVLLLLRAGDEGASVRNIPWSVILMVSGVTTLIALLEKTGGMDLFT
ncbi:MAG TPA: SLC13 family permease, partial [Gemmatimonadaceae bacterium]|nr:SLC13 family permease [Gemmatimonadaceae bacterium]